ncbi:uncharacterized protein LOC106063724 isoform X2 [Biomphalaria glabrata]|uniref:Uncharacterized protein LOC106063724 isoform X2 n=1 Tax=Biomphalaria glabrata TaxID=6526 RepID=A0A9U8E9J3_BIOGL|nr:uncharacterized protein LOC106063724 isoform X2 [Biomphalaria glabrata]
MKSTNGEFLKPHQSTICRDTEKTIEDTAQESFLRENNSMVNKDGQRSSYLLMLGNIASDLDSLLSDLCITNKEPRSKENPSNSGTLHSADTLGKDSFFSSAGNTSKRQGDAVTNHSLSDNEQGDSVSVDSGHEGRCRAGPSPLVFDPHHFGVQPSHHLVRADESQGMDDFRPISTLERVIKTNSIWLLSSLSRAGAVHLLKDRDTGNFIVRKSSQSNNSLALSVQCRHAAQSTVDHYLIESINTGFRLHGSLHSFHSIPALIAYYIENIDEIPYHLSLPKAILLARSTRELASLDMLGQDFWVSPLSRKSPSPEPLAGILHKSSSEPINIQRPFRPSTPVSGKILPNTLPSKSSTDFSQFMNSQVEMERYFERQGFDSPDGPPVSHSTPTPSRHADRSVQVNSSSPQMDKSSVPGVKKGIKDSFQSDLSGTSTSFCAHDSHASSSECHVIGSDKCTSVSSQSFPINQPQPLPPRGTDIYQSQPKNIPFIQQTSCSDASLKSPSSERINDGNWTTHSTAELKTNLYSMTNLNIPENSYFKSNLSDKLSDYEDIWRSSCSEADRQSKIHDPRTALEVKLNNNGGNFVKKKVLRKTIKDSPPLSLKIQASRDAVTGGSTGLSALDQARQIARSDSEEEIRPPLKMDNKSSSAMASVNSLLRAEQNHSVEHYTKQLPSVHYNQITSPNKIIQENNGKKPSLLPLGHLSRLKSSSESSLATASSPLYAEPVDAVKLRDKNGKAINIQVRRLSAPLSVNQLKDKQTKASHKVSKHPQLDTILSPDAQDCVTLSQNKFSFDTSVIQSQVPPVITTRLSRSNSMRTPHEMSQLQRKLSWKDRLNRLKLGTKVLTHNLTPPSAISIRQKNLMDSNQIDVEYSHDLPSSGTVTRKFPTDHLQIQRASGFSESSTVQDLITCVHPELTVCPIARPNKGLERRDTAPPSEYDNLQAYRASTHSSQGTVYSPPWESGTANKLIRDPPVVPPVMPPAMDFKERIQRWQQANSSYEDNTQIFNFSSTYQQSHQEQRQVVHHQHSCQEQVTVIQRQQSHQEQVRILHQQHSYQEQVKAQHRQLEVKVDCQTDGRKDLMNSSQRLQDRGQTQHNIHQELKSQECLGSPQLSNITVQSTDQTFTSANLADISSSTHTSPHVLSSHCPDVVNCHSSPIVLSHSTNTEDEDVLFGGEMMYASEDLKQSLRPVLSPQSSMSQSSCKSPGTIIKEYIFKLSNDHRTIFGSTIENFIQCTLESLETNPQYVMRNVRQFMTGIKNYLVKHGEGELEDLIERERNKLSPTEILNIDAIIEQALHVCVLKPLKFHIYRLFVDKYNNNGALEQLSRNIKYARTKSAQDIGVKPSLKLPDLNDMEVIKKYLDLMQKSYSPLQKLQNLLKATSRIYQCVQGRHHQIPSRGPSSLGADDFLPMLIYVIVHCGLVSAEIEADFMWGLLQPSLLTGEGGYYLTTLSSAVLILKNFQETHQLAPAQMEGNLPTISDMQGFLKIAIPDELLGSITWKTLPVRPNMNSKDVCAMVAHKFKVTNPQDYGLYLLCDGQESHLADTDCPQLIKGDYQASGKTCHFAFKRNDANIAWPRQLNYTPSKQPG